MSVEFPTGANESNKRALLRATAHYREREVNTTEMIDKVYIAVLYKGDEFIGEERKHTPQEAWNLVEEEGPEGYVNVMGECVCGETVFLEHDRNTCEYCRRDYNAWGQELLRPTEYTDREIEMGLDN